MALAGVDVHLSISVFTLTVDDVLTVKRIVLVKWLVRSKAVGIDSHQLLLAVAKQESNRRFLGGFRRVDVRLASAAVGNDEDWWLILLKRQTALEFPACTGTASDGEMPSTCSHQ